MTNSQLEQPSRHSGTIENQSWKTKTILDWLAAHPRLILILAVLACLGPFLAKPFNMDDPLFICTARQIHSHPFDPLGFDINWYGTPQPMWNVTENPPLASYYLALAAGIFRWSELALHSALLLPAIAVILGTYRLARHFCQQPMLAALATLFTPVFLVSSTTVMCDVLMLAFWVWAVVFWVEGIERDSFRRLLLAGGCVALAALTKYYGACLIPLLAVYGVVAPRKPRGWAVALLIPLAALGAYEWATHALYQHALVSQAAGYAVKENKSTGPAAIAAASIALTFTGGCLAPVLFLSPWLWRRRALLMIAGGGIALACLFLLEGSVLRKYPWLQGSLLSSTEAQMILWTVAGVSVLALAVAELPRFRDPAAWLLAFWIMGTFVFTAFINWTINGRSLLPMAPAVSILAARRWRPLENSPPFSHCLRLIPWALAAIFAFLVTQSDFLLASAVRQSATQTWQHSANESLTSQTRKVWFQGHWGFQYYMTQLGGQPVDTGHPAINEGDLLIVPLDNTNVHPPDAPREELEFAGPSFLTTMNINLGAGFYTAKAGPLPFAFGKVPPEDVDVYHWKSTAPR